MAACEVWWATPDLPVPDEAVDPVERARAARFRHQADADRFLVGALLARRAFAAHLGTDPASVPVDRTCRSCGEQHGPPALPGSGVYVSVTHAADTVGVAIARHPVGLDAEPVTAAAQVWAVRNLVCGADDGCAGPEDALGLWVAKEAVLKASGDGLAVPMTDLSLGVGDGGRLRLVSWRGRDEIAARVRLAPVPRPGYAAAVALLDDPASTAPLRVRVRTLAPPGEPWPAG